MVKDLMFIFLLSPLFLFSGEFTASVSHTEVSMGESFTLNLILKEINATTQPSLDGLKNTFFINSQQQSTNTRIINGQMTSSHTWKIALTPLKEGEVQIPSISIGTSKGTLSTEPIHIKVVKANTTNPDGNGVTFTGEASKGTPYKNEPFFYTLRLSSKLDLADVRLQKFTVENAIVTPSGEPKILKKTIDRVTKNVIEFSYLITPLKPGPLTIPSIMAQGVTPMRRDPQRTPFFEENFFMMTDFDRLKPFMVMTKEETIEVQPPVFGMNPWLPARSLKIEENWDDSQTLQEGEPVVRSFKILAEGITSSQLPSINDLQEIDPTFKLYVDKPELGEELKEGSLESFRKEEHTLIPQKSGDLTLPEIVIAWWDVVNNQREETVIPSRTFTVQPRPEKDQIQPPIPSSDQNLPLEVQPIAVIQRDPLLYGIFGLLALLLLAALVWVMTLQNKIMRLTEGTLDLKKAQKPAAISEEPAIPKPTKAVKKKKEKLPDLNPT